MPTLEAVRARERTDRRLIILYGVLVAILMVSLTYITWDINKTEKARAEFEHAIIKNCNVTRQNVLAFNNLLDRLVKAVAANPNYDEAQKKEFTDFYESGRQTVPTCPPPALEE